MAVTYVTAPLPGDSLQKRSTNIPPQLKLILVKGRLGKSSFEDIERVFRNQSLVGVWFRQRLVVAGCFYLNSVFAKRKFIKKADVPAEDISLHQTAIKQSLGTPDRISENMTGNLNVPQIDVLLAKSSCYVIHSVTHL
ncbi:hypothetical protein CEXT_547661 [Caerostris extrusa]|uniref:Uncharacterized protein n=1 Tax=Caerostris extrusa TaxID=172846 RepID=A0AAV4N3H8_CAEEX|nr:hypothetical protein CEXT_547661 [Caerostris extrusa]